MAFPTFTFPEWRECPRGTRFVHNMTGKTGTCTDYQSANHMGWFGSFNEVGMHRLVVVVMLTGGHSVNGPLAAFVAGQIYRNLSAQRYFVASAEPKKTEPFEIISTAPCCSTGHQ